MAFPSRFGASSSADQKNQNQQPNKPQDQQPQKQQEEQRQVPGNQDKLASTK